MERFTSTLCEHGIEHLQDIGVELPSDALDQEIRKIPGQGSGISLQYFWMLAGSDDLVKPDRQIVRFVQRALGRPVAPQFAGACLAKAAHLLQGKYPHLTPTAAGLRSVAVREVSAVMSRRAQRLNELRLLSQTN